MPRRLFNNTMETTSRYSRERRSRELDSLVNRSRGDPWFDLDARAISMVANQASAGRKLPICTRARHVRTRITGMSFGSSYFTLLRATMIGLSAQSPLVGKNCNYTRRCESEVDRFSEFLRATRINCGKKKFVGQCYCSILLLSIIAQYYCVNSNINRQ